MFIAGIINFIRNIIYAKILGPTELGYYSIAMLLSIFGLSFCSLGLYEGSLGAFPVMYGQGKKNEVEVLRNRTSGFILLFSCILLLLTCLVAAFYPFQNHLYPKMIVVCAFFASFQLFLAFLMADMRSRMMTLQFGWMMFWRSGLSFIFGMLAATYLGFMGIVICETIISIILAAFVIHYRMENYSLAFDGFSTLKPIFRVGIPLMLNGFIINIASNLEKFFIIVIFGTYLFGQYSFAMLLVTGAALFQGIVYQHIGPGILYRIGNGENVPALLVKLNKFVMIAGCCLVIFWYPFSTITHFIVSKYFQEYIYTVNLFPIIYIGAGFMILSHYEHFVIAYRKTENILYSNLMVIFLVFISLLTTYLLKLPLIFFAFIFVIGRACYFVITYCLAKSVIRDGFKLNQSI
jgi:O-antigen/teichoic acid export membrane protein